MNNGMFMQIRDYLTSIDSRLGQLITEQKRTNELLVAGAPQTAKPDPAPTAAMQPSQPWGDYDLMNVSEVLAKAALVTDDERAYALTYERAHKNRSTVIKALEGMGADA